MNHAQYSVLNTDRDQYFQLLKCSKDEPCPIYFVFGRRKLFNTFNYLSVLKMNPEPYSVLNTDLAQYLQLLSVLKMNLAQ